MKKSFRCLPVGNLPYTTDKAATKMMVKLFENIPFLANLPDASPDENLLRRTLMNTPGVFIQEKKVIFDNDAPNLKSKLVALDAAFNSPTEENLEQFKFETFFLPKYYQIIERIKPAETVINLIGPFTLSQRLMNNEGTQLLADKYYRKVVIQSICVKALWIIHKIKKLSPETRPFIILEEPLLYKIGDIKRENEDVTRDVIINMFSKVISKIHEYEGLVGIQCFEKCDWKIPIDSGVDLISFDAYNNPNNLNIMPAKINEYLVRGGRINWAIVPVMNETIVKSLSVEYIYDRFIKTIEGLIVAGTSEKLTYNRATISIQGDINSLPLIFAEKALIVANQVSKRIPVKS